MNRSFLCSVTLGRYPGEVKRPAPLDQFFKDYRCPDCGSPVKGYEDSGHDIAIKCTSCGARFGVQLPPFNLIERISGGSQ